MPNLAHLVIVGEGEASAPSPAISLRSWTHLLESGGAQRGHRVIDTDVVSIFCRGEPARFGQSKRWGE